MRGRAGVCVCGGACAGVRVRGCACGGACAEAAAAHLAGGLDNRHTRRRRARLARCGFGRHFALPATEEHVHERWQPPVHEQRVAALRTRREEGAESGSTRQALRRSGARLLQPLPPRLPQQQDHHLCQKVDRVQGHFVGSELDEDLVEGVQLVDQTHGRRRGRLPRVVHAAEGRALREALVDLVDNPVVRRSPQPLA